jgi:KDO2-lipid IV(A) lauroyltransferase
MASLAHQLEYVAARFGFALARALSSRAADTLGVALGRLGHRLVSSRRRLAYDNLKQAMGDQLSDAEIRTVVRQVFENIGRTMVEIARFEKLGPEGVKSIVVPDGLDRLRGVLAEGRGAILATAHFGNWELFGVHPSACGLPVTAVALTQHNPAVNRLIKRVRQSTGCRIIEVPGESRQVFRALKDNRLVVIVADQHASAGTLVMDFFGRPAAVFRGPALFSVRCGSPIIPMLIRRERYDRHVMMMGEPIVSPGHADEETNIRIMTEQYIRLLEEVIRRYPNQWLWTHNRWKLTPSDREGSVPDLSLDPRGD